MNKYGKCESCNENTFNKVEDLFYYCEKCYKEMQESNRIIEKYIHRVEDYLVNLQSHKALHAKEKTKCECKNIANIDSLFSFDEKKEYYFHKTRLKERTFFMKSKFPELCN